MKTFKIFSTAALALMMAACSSEDTALNYSPAQQQGRKVHFTATIAAPGGNAGTRTEYTEVTEGDAAGTINVAWKAKDEIALIHNGTKDVVTVETVNEDGSATITGDITVGTNGEAVTAYYPAAAIELNNDKNPVPAAAYTEKMLAQDGTLSYIASNLDLRSGESTIAVDGDKATLSDNVKLTSQIAIWKLTLLDGESNVLQATQVKIKGGESVLASTTTLATATSVVTLAIPTDVAIDGALTIEATVGSDTYAYTKEEGVTFDSKYYQSTVTMTKASAEITVTITQNDLPPTGNKSFTKDGVTVTAGNMIPSGNTILGPGSFTTTLGNFTKIEVTGDDKPTGWTSGVWTGNASTVEFTGSISGLMSGAFTIVCTIQPAEATTVNLSNLTADYEAKNGETLTGTLAGNYKISIADGATVTLDGVTITGENSSDYKWAGITCEGDATIILKDGSTNTVTGFYQDYPGIYVPGDAENPANNKTLTIKGTGSLTASSNGGGAGIGGGYGIACGNIKIEGGTIEANGGQFGAGIGSANNSSCGSITISGGSVTATGGYLGAGIGSGAGGTCVDILISGGTIEATGGTDAAGIGSGQYGTCVNISISGGTVTATGGGEGTGIGSGNQGKCGDILISGGTIEATGGAYAAAIGSGQYGTCVNITINTGVTQVTATKGNDAPNSIGAGNGGTCGTVTIGCTLDNDGNPVGGETGAISTSPYVYPAPEVGDVKVGSFVGAGDPIAN